MVTPAGRGPGLGTNSFATVSDGVERTPRESSNGAGSLVTNPRRLDVMTRIRQSSSNLFQGVNSGPVALQRPNPSAGGTTVRVGDRQTTEAGRIDQTSGNVPYRGTVVFAFGYSGWRDVMDPVARGAMDDDMAFLRAQGYHVVVLDTPSPEQLQRFLQSQNIVGFVYHGHGGEDGLDMQRSMDGLFMPQQMMAGGKSTASPNLRFVVLEGCKQGQLRDQYAQAFPNARLTTFGEGNVMAGRLIAFNAGENSGLRQAIREGLGIPE